MRGKTSAPAVFTIDNSNVTDATFSLTSDDAVFEPVGSEGFTKSDLDELFNSSDEDRFLRGERKYVSSSNVDFFEWHGFYTDGSVQDQLYVGYLDGSMYEYDGISLSEALLFFRAASPGGMVWDQLRVRGNKWGYQKPYRLVSGNRVWKTTDASIARHEAIPASGAPNSYHPYLNWKGAPGKLGQAGLNLSKRTGSKKVSYFVPTHVGMK